MARRLSDHEYVAFSNAVDVPALNLPPWGGVVHWEGMDVLVHCIRPAVEGSWLFPVDIGPCTNFELTDITDVRPLVEAMPDWEYDPRQNTAVWHVPRETLAVIEERMRQFQRPFDWGFENLGLIMLAVGGLFAYSFLRRPS